MLQSAGVDWSEWRVSDKRNAYGLTARNIEGIAFYLGFGRFARHTKGQPGQSETGIFLSEVRRILSEAGRHVLCGIFSVD